MDYTEYLKKFNITVARVDINENVAIVKAFNGKNVVVVRMNVASWSDEFVVNEIFGAFSQLYYDTRRNV